MGKESFKEKIKEVVYKITLPIYLWSIGFKTLDEYCLAIYEDEKSRVTSNDK